jgi:LDH2 family malate/lactate/ureidoglycolate dehydrogenase
MLLTADAERPDGGAICAALGVPSVQADAVADALVEAELRGHTSRGLMVETQMHPHGGVAPLPGTNPIAIAIPTLADPLLLDMARSATSRESLIEAAAAGVELPLGGAIDATGRPTTDARNRG